MRAAARGSDAVAGEGSGGGATMAGMGYEEGELELELEEGEAVLGGGAGFGGSAADEGFDPDALTFIDEKLQRLLGVFQKKFEGEISAENLGSQYGGYGSFLPAHPHSPLDMSQSRSPLVPPHHGSDSRSPYVPMETPQKNNLIKTALDSSRRIDHYHQISNGSNGNPCPQKLTKAVHGQEQKAPKLRIKVNSNRSLARNTADIYSGLGLDISPSSSVEGSLDGSAGAPVPDDLPDESPHTIFQIMTCYSVPGGLLLSPLAENALELREKPKVVLEEYKTPELHDGKAKLHREWTCTNSASLNNRDRMIKKQSVEKQDDISDFKHSERISQNPPFVNKGINPQLPDISDDTGSVVLPSMLKTEHSVESATFMSEISDQLTETKNDALKGHIIGKNKENKKEPSRALVFLGKTKSDSDESNSRSFTSSCHLQNASNENTSLEREKKTVYMKVEQSQYKGKEMGSLPSSELMNVVTENVDRNSSGMIKVNEEKTSSQAALPRRKIRVKAHKQLKDDTARNSYGKVEKHAVDPRNDLASVHINDKKLKPEIGTIASEVIDNKSCGGNTVEQKINSSFMDKSDPMSSACRNENAESSTALTAPAAVVINEQWVCCDKCEKWRLLPYGMNPDVLPKKWRCSMLSWLPGMSSCKISEDETTRALRALYMVPTLENNTLDGHHDNFAADIGTATATVSKGNIQSMSTPGKLNGCHDGANMVNNLNLNDMSKPSKKLHVRSSRNSGAVDCFPKPGEKRKHTESLRKGESIGKDRTTPMRSSGAVDHDNLRASKKLKKEVNEPATYHSTQLVTRKNSPSVNEASKNMRKHIGNSPRMENYGPSSSHKHHGEDNYFSDEVVKTSGKGKSDVPDLSTRKKKSKERLSSQREPDHLPSNTASKCTPKQSEMNVVMEKPRIELKFPKADRAAPNSRGVTGVDDINISADKVCFEKHQENNNLQHSLPSESSTMRNICHTKTAATTSSSSKVSNSHKDKVDFQGKASPVESVSSSPLRTSDKDPLDQHKRHSSATTENVHSQELGKKGLARSKRKYDFGPDSDQDKPRVSGCFTGGKGHHGVKDGDLFTDDQNLKNTGFSKIDSVCGTKSAQFKPVKEQKTNSVSLSLHDNHNQKQLISRENGKTQPHFYSDQSGLTNLISGNNRPVQGDTQYEDLKINPSTVKGSKQHPALNNAGNGDVTIKGKQSEKAVIVNLEARKQVTLGEGASNPINASVLLKEAKDLKHLSKRLKEKGEDFESTSMCFEAALKFLHVASLWEAPSTESSRQVDPIHAMQLFSETGNLCGFCAHEFERLKKMANAALAYKCMEVAYMKAAFFKHPGAIKDRHALQTASLMAPPAESPSSSASDVDNLNNQSTAAKTVSVRGVYSPQIASNPISRNNHHMMGLLAYVDDINNAFEGTRKSQNSFSAFLSSIGKNQVDDVALVREILDFSFHNVKGLLQLIRESLESINHEGVK